MRSLSIKPLYNSLKDNIVKDFYIPVLSKSKSYKRVSAYFDSNIISLYSKGIENIVNSNGHIYFIFSNELSEHDYQLIKEGYEERERLFVEMKNKLIVGNPGAEFNNLGYLIKNNFVDIKIAFTKSGGIFHDKFGLCESDEDVIYFRGSNNETVASVQSNFESFETTCSWNCSEFEKTKINNALKMFNQLWTNNYTDDVIVFDMPDVIKNQLISFSSDKLIYNFESFENTLIFDYKDRLVVINQLENKRYISPEFSFYKRVFESFVHSLDNNVIFFNNQLNYIEIKNIIKQTNDYALKCNFNVYITDKLQKYLYDKDIMIEKRRSLGISIKERLDFLTNDFNNFCSIVNENMTRKLRLPQLWDAYHMAKMMRGANFSVPGAGKTSIVYGAFAYLESLGEVDKIVMVGPINSFSSWKNEFLLCFGNKKALKVFDYQKEKENNAQDRFDKIVFEASKKNLILFNYESLQSNEDALTSLIDSKTLLVFDEVHRIKAIKGIRAQSARRIGNNSKYRIVLTGTPIPNGYVDLYNMLNILFRDEYDSFFGFDEHFLSSAKDDIEKQQIINNSIYPFFCRTNKDDLNVPPAEPDHIIKVEVTEKEALLFETLYRGFRDNYLLLYIRLIQASNNPKLVLSKLNKEEISLFNTEDYLDDFSRNKFSEINYLTKQDINLIKSFDMTSKFFKGIDLILNIINNGKVLVWGIFIDTLHRIKEELSNHGVKAEVITGATPLLEREQTINRFINDDLDVLITNPHTLGESISLHKTCHQAVYFEYSFNLVHMLQSKDRIHRLGLSKDDKTNYYFMQLVNPNSIYSPIDKKIYLRLKEKENLQNKAMNTKKIFYIEENVLDDVKVLFGDLK